MFLCFQNSNTARSLIQCGLTLHAKTCKDCQILSTFSTLQYIALSVNTVFKVWQKITFFTTTARLPVFNSGFMGRDRFPLGLSQLLQYVPNIFLDCSHSHQHLPNPKWFSHFVLSTSADSSQDLNLDYLGSRRHEIPALSSKTS